MKRAVIFEQTAVFGMKISAFTMARNAVKYYFPIRECILSALPIVDEFIVALGDSDPDDNSKGVINGIGSAKIRIYDRVWNHADFVDGRIFGGETNFALSQCSGDWCLYLQADEVLHEEDHAIIREYCERFAGNDRVDGFLFSYLHFWGDYNHYLPYHGWYRNEIRIIRNNAGIYSHGDAQSFRKKENQKLNVIKIPARIYHYGWVRPPELMTSKKREQDSMHWGKAKAEAEYEKRDTLFDFGALGKLPRYKGSHPKVMRDFIGRMNWKDKLNYSKQTDLKRLPAKHEITKYRLISWVERRLFGGRQLFGYRNWNLLNSNKL